MRTVRPARRALAVLAGVLALTPRDALAQDESPEASREQRLDALERELTSQKREIDELRAKLARPAAREEKTASPELGFSDGFFLRGRIDGCEYELRPRGTIQLDARIFPHAAQNEAFPHPVEQDRFLARRARLGFEGELGAFFFDLELDAARSQGQLPLANFFFELREFDALRLRFGHFKAPLELEDGFTPDRFTDLIERAMVVGTGQTIAPSYRPGVEALGTLGGGLFQYFLAVQNQSDTNAAGSGDPSTTARVASALPFFELGAGGNWENRSGVPASGAAPSSTQLSFAGLTPGQFQFFKPVLVRGWTQRYVVDASFTLGPSWARAELAYGSQERFRVLADHGSGTGLVTQGAFLTLGTVLAGPPAGASASAPFRGWEVLSWDVKKERTKPTVGLEAVLRLEWLSIDDTRGGRRGQGARPAVPSTDQNADIVKGDDCKALSLGLALSPVGNVRLMAEYVRLRIGDRSRAERPHTRFADELLFRAQLAF